MPPPALVRTRLVAMAVVAAAAGCTVRDEPANGVGPGRWWSSAAGRPAGGGLMAGPPAAAAAASAIEFVDGFEPGARRAADAGLPMLLVFRAAWCRWSGDFIQAAMMDEGVARLARRFVCVAIDADRHAETCRTFGVRAVPTVVILDGGGGETFRGTGAEGLAALETALAEAALVTERQRRIAATPDDSAGRAAAGAEPVVR